MIEITNLSCIRNTNLLFKPVSFQLYPQQALIVRGENGVGKSTLLKTLTGLLTPHTGDISWQGLNITDNKPVYWQCMHYIGHNNGLKLGLTVLENLELMAIHANVSQPNFLSVLNLLKLNQHQTTFAKKLSAGQKRRLALAKLFLFPKKLWILDEPLTSLDTETKLLFTDKLKQHLKENGMAVLSTHSSIDISAAQLELKAC